MVEYLLRQCPLRVDDLVSPRQSGGHHVQMSRDVARDQSDVSAVRALKEEDSLAVQGLWVCAALVLDLTDDHGVVHHHYHDLVDDQRQKVLKCEVHRQQFQIVDVKRPLQGGPCARSLVRHYIFPCWKHQ